MENFFRSKRFKILITVIAVLFGIMLYGASSDGIASIPEKLLSYITCLSSRSPAPLPAPPTAFSTNT